jgi:hypothetical protein
LSQYVNAVFLVIVGVLIVLDRERRHRLASLARRWMWGGGSEKSDRNPRTQGYKDTGTLGSKTQFTKEETRNLLKTALTSKVVNPFTRALASPFIERRSDFLYPENTLKSREYS